MAVFVLKSIKLHLSIINGLGLHMAPGGLMELSKKVLIRQKKVSAD